MSYKRIPSRPGYYAGTDGSIWSLMGGKARKRKLTLVRVNKGKDPRYYVSFRIGGKPIPLLVHRLIAEAFHGPCPDGLECCHNNGNGLDNRPDNLRWDTHQSNMEDKVRHGTAAVALTPEIAVAIVSLSRNGLSGPEIAKRMGLKHGTVHSVLSGRTFSHATGLPKTVDPSRRKKPGIV